MDRQEKTLGAAERDEVARQAWRDAAATWEPDEVLVVDETGANVAMTPGYARAPRNARAYDRVPFNKGANITTLAALTTDGLRAAMTVEGAADTPVVEAFMRECVAPLRRPGQKVVLDNVRPHKGDGLRQLVEAAGCQLHFLPAYSPDLAPIEEAFATFKAALRRAKARTAAAVQQAVGPALDAITPQDARHFFTHCGYGTATLP